MLKSNEGYVLTLSDLNKICRYFSVDPLNVTIIHHYEIMFVETQFVDVYTKNVLFGFYNHDGYIRIKNGDDSYIKIHIDNILKKNPTKPSNDILALIKKKRYKLRDQVMDGITGTIKTAN